MSSIDNDSSSHGINYRFVCDDDIKAIGNLFKAVFNRSIDDAYYRWQFLANKNDTVSSVVAEIAGRIVAHVGFTARQAIISGKEGLLYIKQTTMLDPSLRKIGIYSKLLSWAYNSLKQKADLVLSYPNNNSHPIQILRDDYRDIYQIPCLCFNINQKNKNNIEVNSAPGRLCCDAFNIEYKELCAATIAGSEYGIIRNTDYLSWRYSKRPDVKYHLIEYRESGKLVSALIWKYYPGDKPTRIMAVEWLSMQEDIRSGAVLLPLMEYANNIGLPIYIWQNIYQKTRYKILERYGFVMAEPIIHFGGFILNPTINTLDWDNYSKWHIGMGDVDVF